LKTSIEKNLKDYGAEIDETSSRAEAVAAAAVKVQSNTKLPSFQKLIHHAPNNITNINAPTSDTANKILQNVDRYIELSKSPVNIIQQFFTLCRQIDLEISRNQSLRIDNESFSSTNLEYNAPPVEIVMKLKQTLDTHLEILRNKRIFTPALLLREDDMTKRKISKELYCMYSVSSFPHFRSNYLDIHCIQK